MSVELLEKSEHTVLSRIRYPDRGAALLYGVAHHSLDNGGGPDRKTIKQLKVERRETDLTLGKSINGCHFVSGLMFTYLAFVLDFRHCFDAEGRKCRYSWAGKKVSLRLHYAAFGLFWSHRSELT